MTHKNSHQTPLVLLANGLRAGDILDAGTSYYFFLDKEDPQNKIWNVVEVLKENIFTTDGKNICIDQTIGGLLISFDKKKIYNLWQDYPHNLTKNELEIFRHEQPYWADFLDNR